MHLWRTGTIEYKDQLYTPQSMRTAYLDVFFGVSFVVPLNVRPRIHFVFPVCMSTDVDLSFDEALGSIATDKGRVDLVPGYISFVKVSARSVDELGMTVSHQCPRPTRR